MLVRLHDKAEKLNIELLPLPLQETKQLSFEYPSELIIKPPDWVMFTSAAGVESFFTRVQVLGIRLKNSTAIAVIGDKTAVAVKKFGYSVSFIPSKAYGENLFKEFLTQTIDIGNIIYARGEKVNYDPADLFGEKSLRYYPIVCYRTVTGEIDRNLIDRFTKDDYILYTAPSTVEIYQSQFGIPIAKPIAIGRTTAMTMKELGWKQVVTMSKPDIDQVVEYIK